MRAGLTPIGTLQQFFSVGKPAELAIEFKVHSEQPAVQSEQNIFALATDDAEAAALSVLHEMRNRLRLCGDGMKDVSGADSPASDEGTKSANDSFHFRKFRHARCIRSSSRL